VLIIAFFVGSNAIFLYFRYLRRNQNLDDLPVMIPIVKMYFLLFESILWLKFLFRVAIFCL